VAAADLSVTATTAYDPLVSGAPFTVTYTVANAGPQWASNVLFAATPPAGTQVTAVTAGQGSCNVAAASCQLGMIAPDGLVSVTVTTSDPDLGTVSESAVVSADQADPVPGNDSASVSARVVSTQDSDVGISGTAGASRVRTFSTVTYTLTVTNAGPDDAADVDVTVPIPPGVTLGAVSTSQGTCSGTASVVCALGSLANGGSASVVVPVTPAWPSVLNLSASLAGNFVDPDPGDDATSSSVSVLPAPGYGYVALIQTGWIEKTVDVRVGTTVVFYVDPTTPWCRLIREPGQQLTPCMPPGTWSTWPASAAGKYKFTDTVTQQIFHINAS